LKSILTGLADIIFPPKCLTCNVIPDHQETFSICPSCWSKIKFITSPICPCCGIPFTGTDEPDHLCGDCIVSKPAFSSARAVGHYEATILDAVHSFKYGRKIATGKLLGRFMATYTYPAFNILDYTLIMPVPLHPRRLKERGFNQSVILAREIAERHQIPLDFMTLKRDIYTEPQINLGKNERASNVRGAFDVRDPGKISNRKIILVDDVYTTGSTVKECSRILMKKGAASVAVMSLARAV
jgi:ComF family protein